MPDMYRSPSMEPYVDYGELRGKQGDENIKNNMTARQLQQVQSLEDFNPTRMKILQKGMN